MTYKDLEVGWTVRSYYSNKIGVVISINEYDSHFPIWILGKNNVPLGYAKSAEFEVISKDKRYFLTLSAEELVVAACCCDAKAAVENSHSGHAKFLEKVDNEIYRVFTNKCEELGVNHWDHQKAIDKLNSNYYIVAGYKLEEENNFAKFGCKEFNKEDIENIEKIILKLKELSNFDASTTYNGIRFELKENHLIVNNEKETFENVLNVINYCKEHLNG